MAHLRVSLVYDVVGDLQFLVRQVGWQPVGNHVLFELTHELDVVEGVDLQLGQFVVEAALADLGRLREVRVHRKLLAWRLAGRGAAFAHLQ